MADALEGEKSTGWAHKLSKVDSVDSAAMEQHSATNKLAAMDQPRAMGSRNSIG